MRHNGILTDRPGYVIPAHSVKDFEVPTGVQPKPRAFNGSTAGFKPAIPARVEYLEGRYVVVRMG